MQLYEKIAQLRKRNGWSQEELAFRLDVSRQSVSKWEMGASVPELDKIVKMSELFGCSTDYLLRDTEGGEPAPVPSENRETVENEKRSRQVCDEEGENYLALVKRTSPKIALGVAICVLSPMCMFLLTALASGGYIELGEDAAGGVGIAVLLGVAAVGVVFLVVGGIALSKYDYLEKEVIEISAGLRERMIAKREEGNRSFITAMAAGVAICILSVVPLMLAGALGGENEEFGVQLALATLFPIAAIGVGLFVRFGMVYGSYAKLLQENEYTPERKRAAKQTDVFGSVYWCLVTAGYLAVSFITNAWHKTWLVWPVAGVLFGAIATIVNAVKRKGRK